MRNFLEVPAHLFAVYPEEELDLIRVLSLGTQRRIDEIQTWIRRQKNPVIRLKQWFLVKQEVMSNVRSSCMEFSVTSLARHHYQNFSQELCHQRNLQLR